LAAIGSLRLTGQPIGRRFVFLSGGRCLDVAEAGTKSQLDCCKMSPAQYHPALTD